MFRKGPACLSALYLTACAPCFAADPVVRLAPALCPPVIVGKHATGSRHIGSHRHYIAHSEHNWAGGGAPAPISGGGGLVWGLAPGAGQLGAAGLGYYHADNCWSYQSVYDRFGNYVREQPANVCLELPPN